MSPCRNRVQTPRTSEAGVTLVELLIAIVIIAIAAVALLQALGLQTVRAVDPMIQSQAQLLAKQTLDEILSRSLFDPAADPLQNPTLTNSEITAGQYDQSRLGAPARRQWDNLYEYHNYSGAIRNQDGLPYPEFAGYQLAVSVDLSASLQLGTLTNITTTGCPARFARVQVDITDPRGQTTSLAGYRAGYWHRTGC